ncbi:MAG: hypothetical protein MI975_24600 [Cytophagales bacterium]|nr:hypothetical protein [Cytophagales bacterium]
MKILKPITLIFGIAVVLSSCKKNDDPEEKKPTGSIVFNFEHFVDGIEIVFDEMKYVNAAGNQYEVTEIQWFISDVVLKRSDGSKVLLDEEKFAHYIDTNIPETETWELPDEIPAGDYSSISMTFGIKGEKNKPMMFTDPPESDMLWPINLGGDEGGYHYMKLNGFWISKDDQRKPFNFHLGVGQERDVDNNITGFIQNWFEVELPSSSFSVEEETKIINIRMNVEKWWDQPNLYDHDEIGGSIMHNQKAMKMGVENGKNVFSIGSISILDADL